MKIFFAMTLLQLCSVSAFATEFKASVPYHCDRYDAHSGADDPSDEFQITDGTALSASMMAAIQDCQKETHRICAITEWSALNGTKDIYRPLHPGDYDFAVGKRGPILSYRLCEATSSASPLDLK